MAINYTIYKGINPISSKYLRLIKVQGISDSSNTKKLLEFIISAHSECNVKLTFYKRIENGFVTEYLDVNAIKYLVDCFIKNVTIDYDILHAHLEKSYLDATGMTTRLILRELENRGIPWMHLGEPYTSCYLDQPDNERYYYLVIGHGKNQRRIQQTILDSTSDHGVQLATQKMECKKICEYLSIPTPRGYIVTSKEELFSLIEQLGNTPLVVKPNNLGGGVGCFVNLTDRDQIINSYNECLKVSDSVLVEEFVKGRDVRLCLVNNKVICGYSRIPFFVKGDGIHTFMELVQMSERNIKSRKTHLCNILINHETERILKEKNYTFDSIIRNGEEISTQWISNILAGATVKMITNELTSEIILNAEKIVRYLKLDIAAVDMIETEDKAYLIEVNASPGLDNLMAPDEGEPCDFAKAIVDYMYEKNSSFRVPIVIVNDPQFLFGNSPCTSSEQALVALQDPGLEYLCYCPRDFHGKGIPVDQVDIIFIFNNTGIDIIKKIVTQKTSLVFSNKELMKECLSQHELNSKMIFFIDKNNYLLDSNNKMLKKFKSLEETITVLVHSEKINYYPKKHSFKLSEQFEKYNKKNI
jgi:D-alanine-D-alanine ligase-like ATP-grasp enzyme